MNHFFVSVIYSLLILILFGCNNRVASEIYASNSLKITELREGVYIHTSYLSTQEYGKVACNGMIVINDGKAIVCDTPADNKTSDELIDWIINDAKATINAVVVTHFHVDCLGGLLSFHNLNIPSYAQHLTITLAKNQWEVVPNHGFDKKLELQVGDATLRSEYHGAGHTLDNIVCYYEDKQVLFGGCLIKSIGAGKGNLNDADVGSWSATVGKVSSAFPNVEVVIPGHGNYGDEQLLDYTIRMFEKIE